MVVTVMVLASRRAKKTALEDYGFAENMKRTGAYIIGANREDQGVEKIVNIRVQAVQKRDCALELQIHASLVSFPIS